MITVLNNLKIKRYDLAQKNIRITAVKEKIPKEKHVIHIG